MNKKSNAKDKTVLIVEDDRALLEALSDKFSRENFSVIVARNGEEGLEAAFINKPDVILLDIIMPRMDGLTMLRKLRQTEWGKSVSVLVLTNLSTTDMAAQRVKAEQPTHYLVKTDYKIGDIVKKVKEVLK